jgi:hypothetical protein
MTKRGYYGQNTIDPAAQQYQAGNIHPEYPMYSALRFPNPNGCYSVKLREVIKSDKRAINSSSFTAP